MSLYEVHVVGTMTLPETFVDEGGDTQNHTAGIDTRTSIEADSIAEAKAALKEWIAELLIKSKGISFEGVVSASRYDETVLLTDEPFSVEVEITQNVIVDF